MKLRLATTLSLLVAIVLSSGCKSAAPPPSNPDTIRVMSFNLRRANVKDTAFGNGWFSRRAGAARVVNAFNPDVLGTQEGFKDQVGYLKNKVAGMAMHGVGRDNGRREGEYAAIFYRTDRFEQLDGGHRWLSSKPDQPGSRTWWSPFSRMLSWVLLHDRAHDRTLLVINTHFDNVSASSREKSAGIVRDIIEENPADGVVVTGDFNCTPGSRPHDILVEYGKLTDTFAAVGTDRDQNPGTMHKFTGDDDGRRIDWVLVSRDLRPLLADIVRTPARGDRYPSDHFPVTAVLEWAWSKGQRY